MSRGLSGRSLAGAEPQKATRATKTFCDVPLRGRTEFTQQREQAPSASWASEDRNGHGKEANGIKQMRQDDAITDKPHSCLCQRMESISLNRDCLNSRCADAVIFKPIRHGLEDQCVFGLKPYQRERRDVLATTSFLRPKCSGMPHAPSVRLKNSRR